jgi:hypothetical protein
MELVNYMLMCYILYIMNFLRKGAFFETFYELQFEFHMKYLDFVFGLM